MQNLLGGMYKFCTVSVEEDEALDVDVTLPP